jgi:hypothetical protein
MSDMADLMAARDKLKERKAAETSTSPADELDLAAALAARKAGDQPPEPPAAGDEAPAPEPVIDLRTEPAVATPPTEAPAPKEPPARKPRATKAPSRPAQVKVQTVPQPVFRGEGPRIRVNMMLSGDFGGLRSLAKDEFSMTAGHLVMSAVAAHAEALRAEASKAPIATYRSGSRSESWQLLITQSELDELDALADDLARAMGKRSRAGSVALALSRC